MSHTDLEIRRFYIDDEQWDRTSPTWKQLKQKRNFNRFDENDESISEYCARVQEVISVPEPVADQWLYAHYYNGNKVDNYGWIDYSKAEFQRTEISTDEAIKLRVIPEYLDYVQTRKNNVPFDGFACIDKNKEYWIKYRTWRVPPVIADVESFSSPPAYAEFLGPLQLVEGHSRLGYLLSMLRSGQRLIGKHLVYVLRIKPNL